MAASPNSAPLNHLWLRVATLFRRLWEHREASAHLHPDNGVDEEKHGNQQTDIWQSLVGRKSDKSLADNRFSARSTTEAFLACILDSARVGDGGFCFSSQPWAGGGAVAHLERLHKGPEKNSDGVTLTEEFDEASSSEEAEEAQVDEVILGKRRKRGDHLPTPRGSEPSPLTEAPT